MRKAGFFVGACCVVLLVPKISLYADYAFQCGGTQALETVLQGVAKPVSQGAISLLNGEVHALVVFAAFQDETAAVVPAYADALFDAERPGSLTHYFSTMSFGQLQLRGTVVPRRYLSGQPATDYLPAKSEDDGQYGRFVADILRQVDGDIDLGLFDNDGPDGLPNSGDDDGIVDYLFIVLQSAPHGFIRGGATGIAGLGMVDQFQTMDAAARGGTIGVDGLSWQGGAIVKAGSFTQTVGSMAHEFGHALGLLDLYDLDYEDPVSDSAGIGKWGLMGRGAHGWNGNDGPVPLCAWSRKQLGWIGRDNERLVLLRDDVAALAVNDLHAEGAVYQIPLHHEFVNSQLAYAGEYLLLKRRDKTSVYYNQDLPEGMLIWHVREGFGDNTNEARKRVDLVCADGSYGDYSATSQADLQGGATIWTFGLMIKSILGVTRAIWAMPEILLMVDVTSI